MELGEIVGNRPTDRLRLIFIRFATGEKRGRARVSLAVVPGVAINEKTTTGTGNERGPGYLASTPLLVRPTVLKYKGPEFKIGYLSNLWTL